MGSSIHDGIGTPFSSCLQLRVSGVGCRVKGFGRRIWGSGFQFWGLGVGVDLERKCHRGVVDDNDLTEVRSHRRDVLHALGV